MIGGAELYAQALPRADRLYLTTVDADVAGDTVMPEFDAARLARGFIDVIRRRRTTSLCLPLR